MKKLILPLIILCVFGCSNQKKTDSTVKSNLKENSDSVKSLESSDDKIINHISKEIGKPIETRKFPKGGYSRWEKIKIGEGNTIKNSVDKSFGAMPTKTVDLCQSLDENANPIKGEFCQYWVYENPNLKVELDYIYPKSDKDNMIVKLHIIKK